MEKNNLYSKLSELTSIDVSSLKKLVRYKLKFHPNLEEEDILQLCFVGSLKGKTSFRELAKFLNRELQENQRYVKHLWFRKEEQCV